MGKLLRFIAFMVPLMLGAVAGNRLAVKIWPELKERSPWFHLGTGAMGSILTMFVCRQLFGWGKPSAEPARKTDPVIPEAPSDPKTYEEWRKDLDRTVDENAPDFLPLVEFVRKWSDVPRSAKPETRNAGLHADSAMSKVSNLEHGWDPLRNIQTDPNVIRYIYPEIASYVQEHAEAEKARGRTVFDPHPSILVLADGGNFNLGQRADVRFVVDKGLLDRVNRIRLDGIEYVLWPMDGTVSVHLPPGEHRVDPVFGLKPPGSHTPRTNPGQGPA